MQISILAAFVAGLISFLSPCVLPLVPGYVSMLSGIGVEQLRRGEKSRGSLLLSSFAFVMGFSVVFVAFGASASAVGQFLLQNKNLLAPFAGAIIVLFGLHLIGLLGRIPVRSGLIVGAVIAIAGLVMWMRLGENAPRFFGPAQLISVSLIFLAGPMLTRWLNRDVHFRNLGGQSDQNSNAGPFAGVLSGFLPPGFRVRVWLDAVYWPDFGWCASHGRDERDCFARRFYAGCLFGGLSHPIFADGLGHQSIPGFLQTVPPSFARCRGWQRRPVAGRRVSDLRQPLDSAIGQTFFSERLRQVRSRKMLRRAI